MRVCEKHRERATEVLKSLIFGTEYDLCPKCLDMMRSILNGESELSPDGVEKIKEAIKEVENGRKRTAGRPKTTKG
jgi:hypothetical protein